MSHIHNTFERFQHPNPAKLWIVQFSCSLYLYILFVWLFRGGGGGGGGGVALMYIIPSIRFELDFYRILCRVFCFGEILPVVRDFCSLSLVSGIFLFFFLFHLPRCQLMESRGGNNYCWHVHLDAVIKWRSEMLQRRSGPDTSCSAHLTSLRTTLPPGE